MDNATLVIAILAVIAVWAAFRAARRARWERERLDAEGELAEGEVLDVWPEGTAYRVRYDPKDPKNRARLLRADDLV